MDPKFLSNPVRTPARRLLRDISAAQRYAGFTETTRMPSHSNDRWDTRCLCEQLLIPDASVSSN
jgi:hypothetical protein